MEAPRPAGDYSNQEWHADVQPSAFSRTFTVPIIGNFTAEPTETFVVNLATPTNVTIADGQGICTILDND